MPDKKGRILPWQMPPPLPPNPPDLPDGTDWTKCTKNELRAACQRRGMGTGAKKPALIARLYQYSADKGNRRAREYMEHWNSTAADRARARSEKLERRRQLRQARKEGAQVAPAQTPTYDTTRSWEALGNASVLLTPQQAHGEKGVDFVPEVHANREQYQPPFQPPQQQSPRRLRPRPVNHAQKTGLPHQQQDQKSQQQQKPRQQQKQQQQQQHHQNPHTKQHQQAPQQPPEQQQSEPVYHAPKTGRLYVVEASHLSDSTMSFAFFDPEDDIIDSVFKTQGMRCSCSMTAGQPFVCKHIAYVNNHATRGRAILAFQRSQLDIEPPGFMFRAFSGSLCPICCRPCDENDQSTEPDSVVSCLSCGHHAHRRCFNVWARYSGLRKRTLSCAVCLRPWRLAGDWGEKGLWAEKRMMKAEKRWLGQDAEAQRREEEQWNAERW